jgi:hypothetical protein
MVSWWPKRKPPLLHRVLGEENNEESLEQLATKRRVRKRDTFHRNALHVAVRKVNAMAWLYLDDFDLAHLTLYRRIASSLLKCSV